MTESERMKERMTENERMKERMTESECMKESERMKERRESVMTYEEEIFPEFKKTNYN